MLFDFQKFIADLTDNPEKKEVVSKYEKLIGPLNGQIVDQIWYKEYISLFKHYQYQVPEELAKDFDWNLLMQLLAGSFSSDGILEYTDETVLFTISVRSGDQLVVKKVTELWGFQVLRLYEIYSEEMMNLQILIVEDEQEKDAIVAQRQNRLKRWNNLLLDFEKSKIVADTDKELLNLTI